MNKDVINISGSTFRVEINMNTVESWEKMSGTKLGQFEIEAAESAKKGGVSTRAMLIWLYCAIIEGERIEGRSFEFDFIEFKRLLRPATMIKFAPIFIKQYIGEAVFAEIENPTKADSKSEKKNLIRSALINFVKSPWVKWVGVLLILSFAGLYIFGKHLRV